MNSLLSHLWSLHETLLAGYVVTGALLGLAAIHSLLAIHPQVRAMYRINATQAKKRLERGHYAAVVNRSGLWGLLFMVLFFGAVIPFSLTADPQPWWHSAIDVFAILMIYDLIYYLTHRFLFHGKALMWMHSIHHQQKKPCRRDASYLHPLESCIGLALFAVTIGGVALISDGISVVSAVVTFILFLQINWINHDLIESDQYPIKYLQHLSRMHHVHHARFTGGNFATLSLFYDWLFGTYDKGEGWGKSRS